MFNFKTFLRQAAVALALASSSLAALADPISFHVDVNTTGLANGGFLDLQFGALTPAPAASVTFSNFTGGFGAVDFQSDDGVTFNPDGSVTLSNSPELGSLLSFGVGFGGMLGFDLLFSDDYSTVGGTDGSTLTIGLLDAGYGVIGDSYGIARFELVPGVGVDASADARFAAISPVAAAVPEPSDWLLMATGLGLLGLVLRRRSNR